MSNILNKIMHGVFRCMRESVEGFKRIWSDLLQNWLAAGVACPLKLRPVLYRLAGNKIGEGFIFPRGYSLDQD